MHELLQIIASILVSFLVFKLGSNEFHHPHHFLNPKMINYLNLVKILHFKFIFCLSFSMHPWTLEKTSLLYRYLIVFHIHLNLMHHHWLRFYQLLNHQILVFYFIFNCLSFSWSHQPFIIIFAFNIHSLCQLILLPLLFFRYLNLTCLEYFIFSSWSLCLLLTLF